MNKKILCVILFFIITFITVAGCISNASNNKNNGQEKEEAEIGYIENKLMSLLNSLNNITFENYNITVSQINENSQSDSDSSSEKSSNSDEKNEESKETKDSDDSSSEESSQSDSEGTSSEAKTSGNKQYKLKRTGILTKDDSIDWDNIKNETELMYSILPTVTLDLYKKNVSQEDILSFNKEIDNLTKFIEDENKEEALKTLASLYSYIPKYVRTISGDTKALVVETKSNIFYAYSLLETEDWNKIKEYTQKAIDSYIKILNDYDGSQNENTVNKSYILLNELNNSVDLKDKDIFLIKYKNLLEELNIL